MRIQLIVAICTLAILNSAAAGTAADRHLVLNVGDGEDTYPADAAVSLEEALDGAKPDAIDENAEAYFVELASGSTIGALGTPLGDQEESSAPVEASAMSSADSASSEETSRSGWIEIVPQVVSVFYWSESAVGESSWRLESARIFVRQLDEDRVIAAIGGPDFEPPSISD